MACRINLTSQMCLRCLYELAEWDCAAFVTLTYNDAHLPKNFSLVPEHLKKFWKDLRYDLKLKNRTFKYYACGEYGEIEKKYLSPGAIKCHGRPHYHAIIFGLDPFNDDDRKMVVENWPYCDSWVFDKNRTHDQAIDEVNQEDIAYVTGYVQKKLNGQMGAEVYGEAVRPFSRISNGIGLAFALKNKERLCSNGFTYFKNGRKIGIPRYFREKFNVSAADLINLEPSIDRKKFEMESTELYHLFERDMKRKNTWYPENLTMMSIRFERWLDTWQFTMTEQIKKDYEMRRRLSQKL